MVKRNQLEPDSREISSKKHLSSSIADITMGRPPGAKNGTSNGGAKHNYKPPAGNGKGPGRPSGSASSSAAAASAPEKEKTTQDRSQLNFPYDIRLNGYASLQNAVSKGTPKIKRILTEECDYIMECRVCRNLFRSLPNFITHKLNYCKKVFDSTWSIGLSNLIQTGESPAASSFNIEYEVDPELVLVNVSADLTPSKDDSSYPNIELPAATRTRSVADLYSELAERTKVQMEKEKTATASQISTAPSSPSSTRNDDNVIRLKLKPLSMPCSAPGKFNVVSGGGMKSVVVQQQLVSDDVSNCDKICTKPVEILKKDTAIMGPDGKVLCTAPEKGIERVVSRLTAQLKLLEEKEAQKQAALAKNTIICDICKTVFDSDKALRQHKRESLDCGKIWGFKSPIHHDKTSSVSSPSENSTVPCKKAKIPSGSEDDSKSVKEAASVPSSQSGHMSRVFTPSKGRKSLHPRHYTSNGISPTKFKRNLSLSPVKKIKMKYMKLDSSSTSSSTKETDALRSPLVVPCPRCSQSFTTRYEMVNHLVLCTGVINHRYLRQFEPQPEKTRIAIRHDFNKPKPSSSLIVPSASPSPTFITCESHHYDSPTNRDRHASGASSASSSRRGTPTAEVNNNNNKQYKPICEQNGESPSCISSSEDDMSGVPQDKGVSRASNLEEVDSDDITSHDSGVSSASSTKKQTKKLLSGPAKLKGKSTKAKAVKPLSSKNSPSSNPISKSEKKSKKKVGGGTGGGVMSARLEGRKPTKTTAAVKVKRYPLANAVNLRKTISSRLRKSRRVQHPSPQATKKKPNATKLNNKREDGFSKK